MAGAVWRVCAGAVIVGFTAGCEQLAFSRDEMRSRVYPGVTYEEAFKAAGRSINDRFGSVETSDRETGAITSGTQKYNPNALGPAELGRFTNRGGYRSKVQAIVERSSQGAKVNLKVVVERYEEERRSAATSFAGAGDDILFDDRRPNTPLQETLYTSAGRGGIWRSYRIDKVMSDSILADIEKQLRPHTVEAPQGRELDVRPPASAPKTGPAPEVLLPPTPPEKK